MILFGTITPMGGGHLNAPESSHGDTNVSVLKPTMTSECVAGLGFILT
jgi:hypothetical protein